MKNQYKYIAFDLDGTLYKGNQPIEENLRFVRGLKNHFLEGFFFTNNSSSSHKTLCDKLKKFNITFDSSRLYSSGSATVRFVYENKINNIFLIGSNELRDSFLNIGINIVGYEHAQAVVVGLDPLFSYQKLYEASFALQNGAKLIACNFDKNYPIENNLLMPGCGSIISSLIQASGKSVDWVIGKPNTTMLDMLLKDWNIDKNELIIVGDSLESDIFMAKNANVFGILLSNESDTKHFHSEDQGFITVKNLEFYQEIFDI